MLKASSKVAEYLLGCRTSNTNNGNPQRYNEVAAAFVYE